MADKDMSKVYRKAALDRLSSPEQLDKMIRIASPSLWVALAGAALAVLCVLVWAIFGRLPENVDISGIYMSNTGVRGTYATYGGTVSEVYVAKDQQVKAGEPLALVVNESGGASVRQLEERIAAVEAVTLKSRDDAATSDNSQLLEYKLQYQQAGMTRAQKEETLAELKRQLKDAKAETKRYREQMDAAEAAYLASIGDDSANEANFRYQKAQNDLSTANTEYQSAAQTVSSLESTVSQAGQAAASSQQQYASAKSQYDQAESQLASSREQLAGLQREYEDQREDLAQRGLSEEEIAESLASLTENISEMESAAAQQESQLASLREGLASAEASADAAKEQQEKYESLLASAQTKLDRAKTKMDAAEAAFDSAQSAYGSAYSSQGKRSAEQTKRNTAFTEASNLYSNALSTQKSIEQQIDSTDLETGFESDNETVNRGALRKKFRAAKESVLKDLRRELDNAKNNGASEEITSPVDGTVVDCAVEQGQLVAQGTSLVRVKAFQEGENPQIVRCYIPISDGRKFEEGMDVVVTPSTVDEQEYGHMTGKVKSVGTYAVSQAQMMQVLGDEMMAQSFQQQGPCLEVLVDLDRDDSTASGYAWSNRKGRTVALDENTIVTGKVRTKEEAPISKLIPFLKSKLKTEPQESDSEK